MRAVLKLAVALLAVALLVAACGQVVAGHPVAPSPVADRALIADYFERSNAAARDGADAQKRFLDSTQHPDVERHCDLGDLIVLLEPSLGTIRADDRWQPTGAGSTPRGRVYRIAVLVTVRRDGTTLANQVGTMHVVVLDGAAYGFAPCPS